MPPPLIRCRSGAHVLREREVLRQKRCALASRYAIRRHATAALLYALLLRLPRRFCYFHTPLAMRDMMPLFFFR